MKISTEEATMRPLKIAVNPLGSPADMIGPINEELVPRMQSRPHQINPTRRHWIKVEMPDANNAIETKYPVVSKSSFNAPAMISGGVMIATKIASKCWRAAKSVSRRGGRSFNP